MEEKDSLVNEAATYDDLTKLTKEVRSLLGGRVSPGAGVVLAFAPMTRTVGRLPGLRRVILQ